MHARQQKHLKKCRWKAFGKVLVFGHVHLLGKGNFGYIDSLWKRALSNMHLRSSSSKMGEATAQNNITSCLQLGGRVVGRDKVKCKHTIHTTPKRNEIKL